MPSQLNGNCQKGLLTLNQYKETYLFVYVKPKLVVLVVKILGQFFYIGIQVKESNSPEFSSESR